MLKLKVECKFDKVVQYTRFISYIKKKESTIVCVKLSYVILLNYAMFEVSEACNLLEKLAFSSLS